MTQDEQVIEVMKANGGYATLGHLYGNVDTSTWKTKTPYASIRRIVQKNTSFFKIASGLWALKECREQVILHLKIEGSDKNKEDFNHSYYQGLLLEIGNLLKYKTYVPAQDKNKHCLSKTLGSIASLSSIYNFTYPQIVNIAKNVDVIWFNERQMPVLFCEVEHTTNFRSSLLKFAELKYFYADFWIVCNKKRKREFESEFSKHTFDDIRKRVKMKDYDSVVELHAGQSKVAKFGDVP